MKCMNFELSILNKRKKKENSIKSVCVVIIIKIRKKIIKLTKQNLFHWYWNKHSDWIELNWMNEWMVTTTTTIIIIILKFLSSWWRIAKKKDNCIQWWLLPLEYVKITIFILFFSLYLSSLLSTEKCGEN